MTGKKGVVITPDDFVGADWCALAREYGLNTLGIHSGGGANHDAVERFGAYGQEEFRIRCRESGLECEYEFHAAASLLDRTLFEQKPEYFAQEFLNGRRTPDLDWCVTHPETVELLRLGARRLTEALPSSTHRYYYWGADHPNANCHCRNCSRHSFSDLHLLSANAMLRGVRDADPAAELAFLVYIGNYDLPERVQPAEGLFLEFAPYPRCYQHAIDDPGCRINRRYWNSLRQYAEIFDLARAHILEYWLDSSLFSGYRKPAVSCPCTETILRRDLDAYCGLGVGNITTFAVYMDGDYFSRHGTGEVERYAELLQEYF